MEYFASNNPETLKRLKLTDEEADFKRIFDEFFPKMRFFANEYLNDLEDANDIAQSVLATFWEKRTSLNPDTNVFNYLLSLTKNRCIDFIRKKQSREKYIQYAQSRYEENLELYALDEFSTANIHYKELEEQIQKLINKLPASCRQAFLLSRMHGLTYEEIARKLNVSTKTIEKRIAMSLRYIRDKGRLFL